MEINVVIIPTSITAPKTLRYFFFAMSYEDDRNLSLPAQKLRELSATAESTSTFTRLMIIIAMMNKRTEAMNWPAYIIEDPSNCIIIGIIFTAEVSRTIIPASMNKLITK